MKGFKEQPSGFSVRRKKNPLLFADFRLADKKEKIR
jgi:hypothetical protein